MIRMVAVNFCLWGGGGTVPMCGFNSPPLHLPVTEEQRQARQSVVLPVGPAASLHFLGYRDIWWLFSRLYVERSHLYSEDTETLSLVPEPSIFPVQSCFVLSYPKKSSPPFLNSLSSKETSEQFCWKSMRCSVRSSFCLFL